MNNEHIKEKIERTRKKITRINESNFPDTITLPEFPKTKENFEREKLLYFNVIKSDFFSTKINVSWHH